MHQETAPVTPLAVTAPDSIVAGQPFTVKVYWVGSCVDRLDHVSIRSLNDSTISVQFIVSAPVGGPHYGCPSFEMESGIVLQPPAASRFHVRVLGATSHDAPYDLLVRQGPMPAPIERHVIDVEDAAGNPLADIAVILIADDTDTLATLTTDTQGIAETAVACAVGDHSYHLVALRNGYEGARLWSSPLPTAHCGVPEHTILRGF